MWWRYSIAAPEPRRQNTEMQEEAEQAALQKGNQPSEMRGRENKLQIFKMFFLYHRWLWLSFFLRSCNRSEHCRIKKKQSSKNVVFLHEILRVVGGCQRRRSCNQKKSCDQRRHESAKTVKYIAIDQTVFFFASLQTTNFQFHMRCAPRHRMANEEGGKEYDVRSQKHEKFYCSII